MPDNSELKKIKKEYGERFMHLCRELFPTLLEKEGVLTQVLNSSFADNCKKNLYEDLTKNELEEDFKNYIYSKIDVENPEIPIVESKTPYELLNDVGYDLFECKSEEEIQKFKKYYAQREALCTFNGGRLNRCVCFFAVKKNVDNIKRENFIKPQREDEYGTSVMGIQFNKKGLCTVSIKNRYNHAVNNPDATYGNDLDKITPGLTESFARLLDARGLKLNRSNIERLQIPGYTVANDQKYYKYNMEINQTYYCPGNVIIEYGLPIKIGTPEEKIVIDNFVVDIKKKTIKLYDKNEKDSFPDDLQDIEKIEVKKSIEKENGARNIIIHKKFEEKPIIIEIDKNNQIIGYENENIEQIGDCFLNRNIALKRILIPNVTKIGNGFLCENECLEKLEMPKVTQIGHNFMWYNEALTEVMMPNLNKVQNKFLLYNNSLEKLELPKLTQVGNDFMSNNVSLKELTLQNLTYAGSSFLYANQNIESISLPNLEEVGDDFLYRNEVLSQISMPKLAKVASRFLYSNIGLIELSLPSLTEVEDEFIHNNVDLEKFKLPSLTYIGDEFLFSNEQLTKIELLNLIQVKDFFLRNNKKISEIDVPKLSKVGSMFLCENEELKELYLPNLRSMNWDFLRQNNSLNNIYIPNLYQVKDDFLDSNPTLAKKITDEIEKNKKRLKQQIDKQDIANLDKESSLATSEVKMAKQVIEYREENTPEQS